LSGFPQKFCQKDRSLTGIFLREFFGEFSTRKSTAARSSACYFDDREGNLTPIGVKCPARARPDAKSLRETALETAGLSQSFLSEWS